MATAGDTPANQTASVGLVPLWFALLAGPTAWLARLLASSALVPVVCREDAIWLLHGIAAVTAAVCVAGIVAALKARRRTGSSDRKHPSAPGVTSFVMLRPCS